MAKKYILDEFNNKIEVTDEVLTATVQEVKCSVSDTPYKMAFVTQAKYNELEAAGLVQANTIYEIIDDTTADDLDAQLKNVIARVVTLENKHLYKHRIMIDFSQQIGSDTRSGTILFEIENTDATKLTIDTIISSLEAGVSLRATGVINETNKETPTPVYMVCGNTSSISVYSGNSMQAVTASLITNVTDSVKALY